MVDQQAHRHPAAEGVPDHHRARVGVEERRVVQQGGHVVGEVAQAPGGVHRGGRGVAVPAQVGGDHPQRRRQPADQRLPEQRGRAVAVDQQHRRAVRRAGHPYRLGDAVRRHGPLLGFHPRHAATRVPAGPGVGRHPARNEAAPRAPAWHRQAVSGAPARRRGERQRQRRSDVAPRRAEAEPHRVGERHPGVEQAQFGTAQPDHVTVGESLHLGDPPVVEPGAVGRAQVPQGRALRRQPHLGVATAQVRVVDDHLAGRRSADHLRFGSHAKTRAAHRPTRDRQQRHQFRMFLHGQSALHPTPSLRASACHQTVVINTDQPVSLSSPPGHLPFDDSGGRHSSPTP